MGGQTGLAGTGEGARLRSRERAAVVATGHGGTASWAQSEHGVRRLGYIAVVLALVVTACSGSSGEKSSNAGASKGASSPHASSSPTAAVSLAFRVLQPNDVSALPLAENQDTATPADYYKPTSNGGQEMAAALTAGGFAQGWLRSFGTATQAATPKKLSFARSHIVRLNNPSASQDVIDAHVAAYSANYTQGGGKVQPAKAITGLGEKGSMFTSTFSDGQMYTYVWANGPYVSYLTFLYGTGAKAAAEASFELAQRVDSRLKD